MKVFSNSFPNRFGILVANAPKSIPRVVYLFMLLGIIALITAAGYGFVQQQNQLAIEEARFDLATIINLKVSQIVQWRKERLNEGISIHTNPMISHRIGEYLRGNEENSLNEVRHWLTSLQSTTGYSNILLMNPQGEVLISALPLSKPLAGDREIISKAVKKKEVTLSDLHIHQDADEFDINLIIPILETKSRAPACIAVISIDINPMIHLYPLLRSWPTPSRTGENLLVKHDGNSVLYLNELRFRDNAALTLRMPLTDRKMPAVQAALGEEGIFEGEDYRGVDVIAAVRVVPDSPWAIVSKLDTAEILEPVSKRIWYVVGTCVLLLAATGMAILLLWRRRRETYLRKLYESELKFNQELKQAEYSLQEANNLLEVRVAARTEELSTTNTKLRQEIAERKQVEELLRKHFHVIQQSPIAIIITDLAGNIEFVNPKFSEYSGYSYDEAIGQNPRILKTEFTVPHIHEQLWAAITSGDTWNGEFCNRKKNGDLYWEYAKILPFKDQEGKITHYMAFKEDVTRHKQLEEKLLRARKLETIGQIAGGVAHEVRNPLNAILSITEALFREQEIQDNPEFTPYIQHIRTQVNRLADLMNDLLDLGKPVLPANLQTLPLLEVCRQTMELWQNSGMADNRNGTITVVEHAEQIMIQGEQSRLQQVIFNLLENAGYHAPKDTVIELQIGQNEGDARYAVIRVVDAGHGIPPENITRIFEPFYSNRRGGTGLGLSLVKHFIESMGGSVRIWNNEPPPGCTAELHIPIAARELT